MCSKLVRCDRILATGGISTHVIEGSAVVFPFDQKFGLSKKETSSVSNRYPVEVTLEGVVIISFYHAHTMPI